MQAQDIEAHLADLGQELQNLGVEEPVRILMVGGAFMLTQLHNRSTTQDVDVLLKDVDDPTVSPLYRTSARKAPVIHAGDELAYLFWGWCTGVLLSLSLTDVSMYGIS